MSSPGALPIGQSGGVALIEGMIEDWVRHLEETSPHHSKPSKSTRQAAERTSLSRPAARVVTVDGIGLLRTGSHFVHPGTVAVRGRAAPSRAAYVSAGLSDDQAIAVEFVAAWFGAPFDTVQYLLQNGEPALSWGTWGFTGSNLASCLARWKRCAPETFGRILGRGGLDVTEEGGSWRLIANSPQDDGRGVDSIIARNPDLVAAFVQAGREPSAQAAQLESVGADFLASILARDIPTRSSPVPVRDLIRSPRGLATLCYSTLRHGPTVPLELLEAALSVAREATEEGILAEWLDVIAACGYQDDLQSYLQILTSPELSIV